MLNYESFLLHLDQELPVQDLEAINDFVILAIQDFEHLWFHELVLGNIVLQLYHLCR